MLDDHWFACVQPRENPKVRLFCFPFAGGGSMIFRSWSQDLPPEIEVCPLALPGRDRRFRQPGYTRMQPLIDTLVDVMGPYLDELPFAFFGHSMGAAIAYELSHRLRHEGRPGPVMLFPSARRAPHLEVESRQDFLLPDDDFVELLRQMDGTPNEVLANRELMELLIPLLRADFELIDTHGPTDYAPLDCPITAFGGLGDQGIEPSQLAAWGELTGGRFALQTIIGGHFFIQEPEARRRVLEIIGQQLLSQLDVASDLSPASHPSETPR